MVYLYEKNLSNKSCRVWWAETWSMDGNKWPCADVKSQPDPKPSSVCYRLVFLGHIACV